MRKKAETRVSIVLLPEATASTLLSIYDSFNLLPKLVPGASMLRTSIVAEHTIPITTGSGIALQAHASFEETPVSDVVIVPSLIIESEAWVPGRYPRLTAWLQRQQAQGAILCSACSGVFPLLEANLVGAEPVTCHWFYASLLKKSFPDANLQIDKTLIIAGRQQRLVMSGSSGSWHDLVLYLISRFWGPAAAGAAARFFLLNWHPEGQAPYSRFIDDTSHNDAAVIQAQAWIKEHWMQPNPIDGMMHSSGLPERSFKRRFRNATGLSPLEYVQHTRIEHAKQLLENSTRPVDSIAADIGYEDPAFFRKLFKRLTSMTPSAYRLKFRAPY